MAWEKELEQMMLSRQHWSQVLVAVQAQVAVLVLTQEQEVQELH